MEFAATFPWTFGDAGADETQAQEHQALLDALAPGWDTSEGTELYAETWAEAQAITIIWELAERHRNAFHPERMTDLLEDYERACQTRPPADASNHERRRAVAAKLRGLAGNTLDDIEATATKAAGPAFVAFSAAPAASIVSYWDGVNPGPPGHEFMSTRCMFAVHLQQDGMTTTGYRETVAAVQENVDAVKPVWMRIEVGVGDGSTGFISGQGVAGQTVI